MAADKTGIWNEIISTPQLPYTPVGKLHAPLRGLFIPRDVYDAAPHICPTPHVMAALDGAVFEKGININFFHMLRGLTHQRPVLLQDGDTKTGILSSNLQVPIVNTGPYPISTTEDFVVLPPLVNTTSLRVVAAGYQVLPYEVHSRLPVLYALDRFIGDINSITYATILGDTYNVGNLLGRLSIGLELMIDDNFIVKTMVNAVHKNGGGDDLDGCLRSLAQLIIDYWLDDPDHTEKATSISTCFKQTHNTEDFMATLRTILQRMRLPKAGATEQQLIECMSQARVIKDLAARIQPINLLKIGVVASGESNIINSGDMMTVDLAGI
jgi:hypothetical protein